MNPTDFVMSHLCRKLKDRYPEVGGVTYVRLPDKYRIWIQYRHEPTGRYTDITAEEIARLSWDAEGLIYLIWDRMCSALPPWAKNRWDPEPPKFVFRIGRRLSARFLREGNGADARNPGGPNGHR